TVRSTRIEAPLWTPTAERVARARLTRFAARYRPGAEYTQLWRWSVEHPEEFWPAVWEFCGVIASRKSPVVLADGDKMPGARWFPEARLNFAENLLRHADDREALVAWDERGRRRALSFAELRHEVARWQAALRREGVRPGDRVAGWLPNVPEAVIAMLAATSLGAVWSSCSPDFGARAVVERFAQIKPRVLVAADGYRHGGDVFDLRERLSRVAMALPGLKRVVLVGGLGDGERAGGPMGILHAEPAEDWLAAGGIAAGAAAEPEFLRLPFDHPLYVLYSSGTVGLPKAIVHGAGGTLLQHLKEHALHTDIGREDRVYYYTTCGWMMWNWLVSALASGATVVLYDGSPLAPRADSQWAMAAAERISVFGVSAKYLALIEKAGVEPARDHDLSALRAILSTGSPLAAHSFDYVYERVKRDVHLASITGGTDLVSCFALGNPTAPVWRGEIQCRGLGMAVEVFDGQGRSVVGEPGELVCTRPFPTMPLRFWNDPDGSRYRAAYFERFPGVWRHGDWAGRTVHDGLVVLGRSDATLNPGGVRIGTAEIYRQVERLPEVLECLAVGQDWEEDVRVVLFVRLRDRLTLDEPLRERIRREILAHTSRHHVPRKILQVPDLPRTLSGKLSELAVRAVIHGRAVENAEALATPGCLEHFRDLPELRS
ncbi:MAG TPA: acetoacetate--CoA ligase, partial [Terriglobales bacterium]|nr:acetoacetate--CoA ligase [Terriglobales bacterium]